MEPEELMKREIAKDPWEPRLKLISKDECTLGGMPAWIIRSYNSSHTFDDPKKGARINHGVVCVRSMWWPGAYSFFTNGRSMAIYCGNGQKHEQKTYYPIQPPVMMDEVAEKKCYDEPNPTEKWLADKAEAEAKAKANAEGNEGD